MHRHYDGIIQTEPAQRGICRDRSAITRAARTCTSTADQKRAQRRARFFTSFSRLATSTHSAAARPATAVSRPEDQYLAPERKVALRAGEQGTHRHVRGTA